MNKANINKTITKLLINPLTYLGIAELLLIAIGGPFVYKNRNPHHSRSHNNSNYNAESNDISEYSRKRNALEKLFDTDKNKVLDNAERMKMYKLCGIADKPAEYVVTLKDLNRGIDNYNSWNNDLGAEYYFVNRMLGL